MMPPQYNIIMKCVNWRLNFEFIGSPTIQIQCITLV